MRVGVVTFPGTLDDKDAARAVTLAGGEAVSLWHGDADLHQVDAVILPGGFSYGDYLRCGAISSFAPVMQKIVDAANGGMPVLGICNGFQVLCESHLLPGALIRNDHQQFICRDQPLRVENVSTPFTSGFTAGQEILVPLKNGEGGYIADDKTLDMLEAEGRVVFRYTAGGDAGSALAAPLAFANPNGSLRDIAGISNERGNVVGLMPHPEHAVEVGYGPDTISGARNGIDGLGLFTSLLQSMAQA